MLVELVHGDIVKSADDAVIITVDGTAKGLEGNIARQFKKHYGEAWECIEESFSFPIPLGRSDYVEAEPPIPQRVVFAAAILDHKNIVGRHQMPAVVRSALSEILETSARQKIESIATPLLRGGWRMDAMTALKAMVDVADEMHAYQGVLRVFILDDAEYEAAVGYGRTFGIIS